MAGKKQDRDIRDVWINSGGVVKMLGILAE
jgi:hypothetical protein